MSIFKRLKDVISATFNGWLDKAEDPVKMLDQYMRELEGQIADAETAVAKHIALTKKFEAQMKEAQNKVQLRQQQAVDALQHGNEDLARRALADKKTIEAQAQELSHIFSEQSKMTEQLKSQLFKMKNEYQQMRSKKHTLEARHESAKAMKSIQDSMSEFGGNSLSSGFAKMEQKVLETEALAEASMDLNEFNSRTLDDESRDLQNNSDVDSDLEELKRQLGQK